MINESASRDLVLLVADQNIKATMDGLLDRQRSLRIRPPRFVTFVHPEHDPGCLRRASEFLRPLAGRFDHALVLFDREGCGRQQSSATQLEQKVVALLERAGWKDRAAAVVFDPELEIWVWSDSPEVEEVLGWTNRNPTLRSWLVTKQFMKQGQHKPSHPKKAMECALREVRRPRSSLYYQELARRVGLNRCRDGAFLRLCETLRRWFPTDEQ